MKALYMTFFVSKFHGTGSISLGDILFLSVRLTWLFFIIKDHLEKNRSLLEMVFKQKKIDIDSFLLIPCSNLFFTTLIFYIVYDQSQARTILFC